MAPISLSRPAVLALSCALLLTATACGDALVTSPTEGGEASASFSRGGAPANRGPKYRDSGRSAATGRSGTATLTAFSVRGDDGVARLTLTSGGLADPGSGRGEISKAQVKVFAADGTHLTTLNYHRLDEGVVTVNVPGVPPGATFQVQANIRGIDGRRTDVVTVTDTVRAAPSVGVDLNLPPQTQPGVPTVVEGVVTEVNGDVGAWVTCRLYVNGVLSDQTAEVWVDAGDNVSCAFAPTFNADGEYPVEIVVSFDDGDGMTTVSDTDTILVETLQTNGYTASAADEMTQRVKITEYSWVHPNGSHKAYSDSTGGGNRTQNITLRGTLNRPVSWPVSFTMRASSPADTWVNQSADGVSATPGTDGNACAVYTLTDGGTVQICSLATGTSTFAYTRFVGTITYRSIGWYRVWDAAGGVTAQDSWNSSWETYETSTTPRIWNGALSVDLQVTDGTGPFGGAAIIPLTEFSTQEQITPYSCVNEYPYWLEGNAQVWCTGETEFRSGQTGSTTG